MGLAPGITRHAIAFDQPAGDSVRSAEYLPNLTNAEHRNLARRICAAACADAISCRMFLCGCCHSQVLVCRWCDRGQVYCIKTCAQKAHHDQQRKARRRGRAMHAERNRRYRARMRRVTDHGPAKEPEGRPSFNLDVGATLSQPAPSKNRQNSVSVITAGARRLPFCTGQPFGPDVIVKASARSTPRQLDLDVDPDDAPQSHRAIAAIHRNTYTGISPDGISSARHISYLPPKKCGYRPSATRSDRAPGPSIGDHREP